jgi:hypothetical protein
MTVIYSNLYHGTHVRISAPRQEDIVVIIGWEEDAEYLRNIDTDIALH